MFALLATVSLWQVNGQTYNGNTGGIPDANCPTLTPFDNAVSATGVIGANVGDFALDNVTLDISHTWDSDLTINLVSPSGLSLELSSGNGGSGDNYTNTVFQDGAPSITTGSAPFTGTFSAEGGSMAATFAGEDVNGNWSLNICDQFGGDVGGVNSWTLTLSEILPPPPYLFSQDCSEEMPLEFNPPVVASAGVVVADSGYPSDTGIIGTGLGQYVLESVVINVEGEMAQDVDFFLQPANLGGSFWFLGGGAGGTDGMDTAVDLTFTDSSSNNYSDWTGGAPAADLSLIHI